MIKKIDIKTGSNVSSFDVCIYFVLCKIFLFEMQKFKIKTKHVSPLIRCRKTYKAVQGNSNPGPNYGLECSQTNHWKDRKAPLSTPFRTCLSSLYTTTSLFRFGFIVLGFFLTSVSFSESQWRCHSRLQHLCGQSSSASHSLLEVRNFF